MKEIDFLPEWYKNSRRRQISYRTQYIALGCVFVMMVGWNFLASRSVSKAATELAQLKSKRAEAESASGEFARIESEVLRLQEKANILEEIDSKINVANVLAEMSFLIGEEIVLGKVELVAERFEDKHEGKLDGSSVVRAARAKFGGKPDLLPGAVRFKVVIGGIAADAADVAELICKLEDSPYFWLVYPSFSRSRTIKTKAGAAGEDYKVTEFEISCYLANYRQEESSLVKVAQNDRPVR